MAKDITRIHITGQSGRKTAPFAVGDRVPTVRGHASLDKIERGTMNGDPGYYCFWSCVSGDFQLFFTDSQVVKVDQF